MPGGSGSKESLRGGVATPGSGFEFGGLHVDLAPVNLGLALDCASGDKWGVISLCMTGVVLGVEGVLGVLWGVRATPLSGVDSMGVFGVFLALALRAWVSGFKLGLTPFVTPWTEGGAGKPALALWLLVTTR